jgi:hypothetical protein
VIDGVLGRLRVSYVDPELAGALERSIRARARRGAYDRIVEGRALADTLTAQLQALSGDRHLRVVFSADPLPAQPWRRAGRGQPPGDSARAGGRRARFGFGRADRLPGNVGYVELRSFAFDPALAAETVAEQMSHLADADALILDLRRNGGGSPRLPVLIASYLFGSDSVLFHAVRWSRRGRVERLYTHAAVAGERFGPTKPVYVLTARRTFSAAEAFAYGLQARGRAVIVGDTTGGGAYVGGLHRVTDHFGVWVSAGRPINPVTRTNWERVGVRPDVAVPADSALPVAHREALRALREAAGDPEQRQRLAEALDEAEGRAHPGP